MRMSDRQREYMAGFYSNMSVVLIGLALTDQPFMGRRMTWLLRGCIIGMGLVPLLGGLWLEPRHKERRHD